MAGIEDYQRAKNRSSAALILLACAPMLHRLLLRLDLPSSLTGDDGVQLVVQAFMEAVRRFPVARSSPWTWIDLRRATEWRVFLELQKARAVGVREVSPDLLPRPALQGSGIDVTGRLHAVVDLGLLRARMSLKAHEVELADATIFGDERVVEFASRTQPQLDGAELVRAIDRLKHQRARLIARALRGRERGHE